MVFGSQNSLWNKKGGEVVGSLLVQLYDETIVCSWKGLRTNPSSGQATSISMLCHPKLPACHSGAAFDEATPDEWEHVEQVVSSVVYQAIVTLH